MYPNITLAKLDEYFTLYNSRRNQGIYCYRLTGYNEEIEQFLKKYVQEVKKRGVWIEGRIPNPDERNLTYYEEIMGLGFQMSLGFLGSSLKKWLPRLNGDQRTNLANAMYDTLSDLRKEGKNENMLKNAYIKFMCWLYYRFERILCLLGGNQVPKILYEGDVSNYELKMLGILAQSGCDLLILEYHGDAGYQRLDAASVYSRLWNQGSCQAFPKDFSIRSFLKTVEQEERILAVVQSGEPELVNCTNAWISGHPYEDILKGCQVRGEDGRFYYNCFIRIKGAEDKITYQNELFQFYLRLKGTGRKIVIVEKQLELPTPVEIGNIKRGNYAGPEQMAADLSQNLNTISNKKLCQILKKQFILLMLEESKRPDMNLNRLINRGVYVLCWLKRFANQLFLGWKYPEIAVFLYLGACKTENEVLFIRLLSRLPVDVLLLVPNRNESCLLKDSMLFEKNYTESLSLEHFPKENVELKIGTAAYHAEQELNQIIYEDTGLYRTQQYHRAITVGLQTIYEEINILWNQEEKYRPSFQIIDDQVTLPVIFAKVSGVKNGDVEEYWRGVKKLLTEDTFFAKKVPIIVSTEYNPMKQYATEFFKNGKLQKEKIKIHPAYQYRFLRADIQDYLIEKMQLLIDQRLIRGTFTNGTEYTIVATLLNMKKDILRSIQKIDFTKVLPKIVCIDTNERTYSLEDSILLAFLNLVGFDVVLFTPTGYQNLEQYYQRKILEEHIIGEYLYDLQVPDFNTIGKKQSWRDKIFRKEG